MLYRFCYHEHTTILHESDNQPLRLKLLENLPPPNLSGQGNRIAMRGPIPRLPLVGK